MLNKGDKKPVMRKTSLPSKDEIDDLCGAAQKLKLGREVRFIRKTSEVIKSLLQERDSGAFSSESDAGSSSGGQDGDLVERKPGPIRGVYAVAQHHQVRIAS